MCARKSSTVLKERLKCIRANPNIKTIEEEFTIKDSIKQLKSRIFNVEEDLAKFGGITIQNKLLIMKNELKELENKLALEVVVKK